MKCPKCDSEHVQFTTSTHSTGFSLFDSCCGLIIMGPLGLLCGACGMGSDTEEFWICHDCGHKFSTREGQRYIKQRTENEQRRADNYATYKAELESLSGEEGSIQDVREHYQEAVEECKEATQQYDQLIIELTSNDDIQIKKLAKRLHGERIATVIAVIIIAGFAMMFLEVHFGLCLLAIGIISAILYEFGQKKSRDRLTQMHMGFRTAIDNKKEAEERQNHYKILTDKITYIEKYEAEHNEP